MRETDYMGYSVVERPLGNGWYELSTMSESMGEEYRECKRYDHQPSWEDYTNFVYGVERNK